MGRNSVVLAAAFLMLACAQEAGPQTTIGAEEALRAADAALSKAVDEKDSDAVAAFYANGAILMPTAEPAISGADAIREEWKHILSIPDFTNVSSLLRVEIAKSGDLAYTMGSYTSTMMGAAGDGVTEPGKWLTIWKKTPEGEWKIVVDTYNTDIYPPVHQ